MYYVSLANDFLTVLLLKSFQFTLQNVRLMFLCHRSSVLRVKCMLYYRLLGKLVVDFLLITIELFTVRWSNASTVLGVVILSVRLSFWHTQALWQNKRTYCRYFDITWKSNHSSFLTPTLVDRWRPLPPEVCAQNDPLPSKNADFDRFPFITSQL